jgi:hypothetical protein
MHWENSDVLLSGVVVRVWTRRATGGAQRANA